MRALLRSWLAFALAIALAVGRAEATGEPGVCIAVAGREHAAAADAAGRALGVPARRLDVRDDRQRDALAAGCERLVIAVGSEALRVATGSAPRSPIVTLMAANARASGRPGVLVEPDPRRVLETLRKMAPAVRRVGAVFDPSRTGGLVADAQDAARALGLELVPLPVHSAGEAVRAFRRFERELRVDALWLLPDGTATVQETVYYALELAHWRRMAVIGPSRWYVASGALFALLPRQESTGAAAAELGQQVLRGAPGSAVYARDNALYVNQRTATRLGIDLPRTILESAEEVLP